MKVVPQKIADDVERFSIQARSEGATVEIDWDKPSIRVWFSKDKQHEVEGAEAQELLDAVPHNIEPRDWILSVAYQWDPNQHKPSP